MAATKQLVEKEITLKVPWGKMAALTWGDPANPPVILCHGKLDVASSFRPLVQRLPKSFFYLSVDLPGNGKSDYFPSGGRFTVVDFVPTITRIMEHYNWGKFAFIGHSLGVIIGKYFNIAYPGYITRMVELDPIPAHETWPAQSFASWYHLFYGDFYSEDRYRKSTAGVETAPKYTYEKALKLMMETRGVTEEAASHILERALTPTGDGLFRYTYDQRLKEIPRMPWSPELMREVYTAPPTPTLAFLSKTMTNIGFYKPVPFVQDPAVWPNKNYQVKTIAGGHDFHINNPEYIAEDISKFLMADQKAKL